MKRVIISIVLVFACMATKAQDQTNPKNFLIADDGTKLFVEKSGNGQICIFIHGGPGAWSKSFEDLKGSNLESNLSMVYYDQRGCGRSEKSAKGDYSVERMIKDIDLIRNFYRADKVYLIAHSFGGILAVNYALKFPNHVKGLIFANSTLDLRNSLENQLAYINDLLESDFAPSDSSSASLMTAFLNAKKELSAKGLDYKMLSDNKKNVDILQKIDAANPSDYDFAQKVFSIDNYWRDYTKITKHINLPVLVITGKRDHSIGINHYTLFKFPNEKIKMIDGGHLLYYENNEEFITSIFEFINEVNNKKQSD